MLIVSFKPGHDGAIAAIRDGSLVLSLEAQKDSSERYSELHPGVLLELAERLDGMPDVVALSGWGGATPGRRVDGRRYREIVTAGQTPEAPVSGYRPPDLKPRVIGQFGAGYIGPWAAERQREADGLGAGAVGDRAARARRHGRGGRLVPALRVRR